MRSRLVLAVLSLLAVPALAQIPVPHQGFYASMGLGVPGGDIDQDLTNGPYAHGTFSGTGLQLDARIGGAVSRNNLLTFDVSARVISGPKWEVSDSGGNRASTTLSDKSSVGDAIAGVGFTHYFMPANAFVGVTAGLGSFTFDNGNQSGSSKRGFGYILRGGKEWRLGRKWGLGVVGGLAHLSANDKADPDYPGYASTFTTTRVFVGFSATLN